MKTKLIAIFLTLALLCVAQPVNLAFASETSQAIDVTNDRYAEPDIVISRATETLNYSSYRIVETNTTPNECPFYYNSSYANSCGAVAGSNIIGYYDKYYEDLIPGYVAYYTSSGRYKSADSTYIPQVVGSLYTSMRTNVDDVGISYSDFFLGLTNYVNSKGRTLTYSSAYSSFSGVNYSAVKSAIDSGNVLAVFCDPTTILQINLGDTSATFFTTNIISSHIMIVYGYMKVEFTFSNNTKRTDTYLLLSTGLSNVLKANILVDSDDIVQLQKIVIT